MYRAFKHFWISLGALAQGLPYLYIVSTQLWSQLGVSLKALTKSPQPPSLVPFCNLKPKFGCFLVLWPRISTFSFLESLPKDPIHLGHQPKLSNWLNQSSLSA